MVIVHHFIAKECLRCLDSVTDLKRTYNKSGVTGV